MVSTRTLRVGWMDSLRGLSVSLVLIYHASGQLTTGGLLTDGLTIMNDLVAPLRMPTMVFLSGLLVPRSLAKGARAFLMGKVRGILHPYFVWTAIMIAVWTGVLGLMQFRWRLVIEAFWQPFDHLWFLYFLFLYYVIVLLTRPIRPVFVAAGAVVAAVALTVVTGENKEFAYLAAFFLLGVDVAARPSQWAALLRTRVSRVLAVSAVVILVSLPFWNPASGWYNPYLIPIVALVILSLWHELSTRTGIPRSRALEAIGRDSIVYYIVHWPVVVAVRQLLEPLQWGAFSSLAVGLVLAFGVSALLAHLRHTNALVAALFAWPAPAGRVRPAPLPASEGERDS